MDTVPKEVVVKALRDLLVVMEEIDTTSVDGKFIMPGCEHFLDEDGFCRVCTAMQNADQVLGWIREEETTT